MRLTPDIEEIKRVLAYDPATGIVRWRRPYGGRYCGQIAGAQCKRGYISINFRGVSLQAHRIAWALQTGNWPAGEIDHIDHDPSNNRWSNLRDVSRSVNHQNRIRARANSRTGLLGARYCPRSKNFFSEIKVGGKYVYLGTYRTAQEAHAAYVDAKRKHHVGCTL